MGISPELLKILACPKCKGPVDPSPDQQWLICPKCALKYEVCNDIPIMLVDEAKPLDG